MDAEKTKAVVAIEAQMAQVPPGSYRHQVLEVARDFKNAWVSLGAHLTKVRDGALYKEWGYDDFEAYCQRELHIRKATAHKLTATYGFMQRHEPRLLERAEADPVRAQVPAFEVVQVLSRAEERGQIGEAEYREVRDRVFEGARPPAPSTLARAINGKWPAPPPPEADRGVRVRQLSAAARRLADGARRSDAVPEAVKDRAEALAEDFIALLEAGAWRDAG